MKHKSASLLKRNPQTHKKTNERGLTIEHDVLSKHFADSHCGLWFLGLWLFFCYFVYALLEKSQQSRLLLSPLLFFLLFFLSLKQRHCILKFDVDDSLQTKFPDLCVIPNRVFSQLSAQHLPASFFDIKNHLRKHHQRMKIS